MSSHYPKPNFCLSCPITNYTHGYVPLNRAGSSELWVGEVSSAASVEQGKPFVDGVGTWLGSLCRASKIDRHGLNVINSVGCANRDGAHPCSEKWTLTDRYTARAGAEYCYQHHLLPVVNGKKWSRVVALGEQAMSALTPRHGVYIWRGSPLPLKGRVNEGPKVVPTLHPSDVMINPKMFSVVKGDLRKSLSLPPENYVLFPTPEQLAQFTAKTFAFDFEWGWDGKISLCGLSDKHYHAIVAPFEGRYIPILQHIFEQADMLIGHNIVGADTKYFRELGWEIKAKLFDTMLAQHLVQPDLRHGLGFVASVFTNKVFWKGQGEESEDDDGNVITAGAQWKTWDSSDAIPKHSGGYGGCNSQQEAFRLYNARDTDGSLQCAGPLANLLRQYNLEHIYWNVSVPVAHLCKDMCDTGMRIDNQKVIKIRETISREIAELEQTLPDGLRPYEMDVWKQVPAPPGTYKRKVKKCKGSKKDGTSHAAEPCEIVFNDLLPRHCDICNTEVLPGVMQEAKTIKVPAKELVTPWNSTAKVIEYAEGKECPEVLHPKSGRKTGDKKARKVWGREHVEFTVVDTLKTLATRKNSFAKPGMMYVDRLYFNLLPHGTSEGRLSSSGRRRGEKLYDSNGQPIIGEDGKHITITDPNIQNQPKLIRDIFIPDHDGWGILNLDICQGENMLTAWLAQDFERLERLNTKDYDEHSDLASRVFKCPVDKKTALGKALRQVGKKINHARNYGMGWKKMQMELALEGNNYTAADVKEMIEEWKRMNRGTAEWQDRTIRQAEQQGYLVNPFGRKRWFQGRDFGTKALAFLPASTLADCMLRMMIGIHADRFGEELFQLRLERTCVLPQPWRMFNQVHDSIGLMGPDENHLDVAAMVKSVMTQPWKELGGYALGVEVEYSTESWGGVKVIHV
jgi:DNA polymerase I-like protein with 3'-5' exonuclease and polymerase domains/uracil-DNA glycosylase